MMNQGTNKGIVIKTNLKLFPWQTQVKRELEAHRKGYTHVIKAKRQVGKSTMLEIVLLQTAINHAKTVSICLSPTLEQARKVFKAVKNIIIPTRLYRKHNDVSLSLSLANGSDILFKSAEQKVGLKGYTVTGVYCVDEAAYIPDEIFYDTLAWVNVSQAPIVMVSTPFHKTGFFYKYFCIGNDSTTTSVLSYDWSQFDTSALLPADKLEEYRREVPASKFKTEFLGEFLDTEGGVFGEYGHIISDELTKEPNTNCFMGIDWGTGQGQDETAICVFNSERQMTALYHFNDKDETQTIEYIVELIKKHKPLRVQVESNSIGAVFYGLLDKAVKKAKMPVMVLKFTTTNESKERLINAFQVAVQNNRVQILNNAVLQTQMDMYEMKVTSNNKRTYNAATGYKDDCIIAMLLAYDCITKGQYNVR